MLWPCQWAVMEAHALLESSPGQPGAPAASTCSVWAALPRSPLSLIGEEKGASRGRGEPSGDAWSWGARARSPRIAMVFPQGFDKRRQEEAEADLDTQKPQSGNRKRGKCGGKHSGRGQDARRLLGHSTGGEQRRGHQASCRTTELSQLALPFPPPWSPATSSQGMGSPQRGEHGVGNPGHAPAVQRSPVLGLGETEPAENSPPETPLRRNQECSEIALGQRQCLMVRSAVSALCPTVWFMAWFKAM